MGSRLQLSAGFNDETDCRSFLALDIDRRELWDTDHVDAIFLKVASRNGGGLDGLIDRPCTDGLDLGSLVFPNDSGNGSGDR